MIEQSQSQSGLGAPAPAARVPGAVRYRQEVLEAFYDGLRSAGINFAVFLPDSLLDGIEQLILEREEIPIYQCSREDEGIGMAMGAYLVGKKPVAMMEGSGIGLSALVLARGIAQRTPTLLIAGHNSTLGESFDYHASVRQVTEPVLAALHIPYHVVLDPGTIKTVVVEAQRTVEGQRIPVAILVPSFVIREQ